MGSRYGSLKQMDGVGPSGEAIIDYSIYDAIRAGFTKVVFVIRHSFEKDFRELFSAERFGGRIAVEFVFQELDYLPAGFTVPEGREKPWGTNHAVMMAADVVKEPFAVINADDFYGRESFAVLGDYLRGLHASHDRYAMVGFSISNTLSDNGTVSRGVCSVDGAGNLAEITERHGIERRADGQVVYALDGAQYPLGDDTPVSMNMFGFTPDYFSHSDDFFRTFLAANAANIKAEFYIPLMVDHLIKRGTSSMRVLPTRAVWFGVTYKEDKPMVEERLRALVAAGEYPDNLWK
jgi:dTDP-glucose pyrophosphorylase